MITFSGGGANMEMVQTKDRILQLFEWTWEFRDIWMDGRKLPKVDDYLPRFNGYSVGKWEGDTLVVTSVGSTTASGSTSSAFRSATRPYSRSAGTAPARIGSAYGSSSRTP